jgi:hypothetical protein
LEYVGTMCDDDLSRFNIVNRADFDVEVGEKLSESSEGHEVSIAEVVGVGERGMDPVSWHGTPLLRRLTKGAVFDSITARLARGTRAEVRRS